MSDLSKNDLEGLFKWAPTVGLRAPRLLKPDFAKAKRLGLEIPFELELGVELSANRIDLIRDPTAHILFLDRNSSDPIITGVMAKLEDKLDSDVLEFCRSIGNLSHHTYNFLSRPPIRRLVIEAPFVALVAMRANDMQLLENLELKDKSTPQIITALLATIAKSADNKRIPYGPRRTLLDDGHPREAALAWISEKSLVLDELVARDVDPFHFARIVFGLTNVRADVVSDAGSDGCRLLEEVVINNATSAPLVFTTWADGLSRIKRYAVLNSEHSGVSLLKSYEGLCGLLRREFRARVSEQSSAKVDACLDALATKPRTHELPLLLGHDLEKSRTPNHKVEQISTASALKTRSDELGFTSALPDLLESCREADWFAFEVINEAWGDACEIVVFITSNGRVTNQFGLPNARTLMRDVVNDLELRFSSDSMVLYPSLDAGDGPTYDPLSL